jgi:tetratricopeptide (TPR) repeat protein
LLTAGSGAIYQSLLKSEKHVAEDNEGLALLAMRAGDNERAATYMEAARRAGTHNAIALTAYAAIEKDSPLAIAILKEALSGDAKYAPAHWALGERIDDKPRRLAEWKQAVTLAPQNSEWWARYARLCVDQKQYVEASRAWMAAAQSAPDAAHREQYLSARGQIDQFRLDDEDAIRRRETAAKAAEIDRLKAQAKKELNDLEARANSRPMSKDELANTVDWTEINGGATLDGSLTRVECVGRQLRLEVKDGKGQIQRLLVPNASQIEMTGAGAELPCGVQKPRTVRITYKPAKDTRKGFTGEATVIEFR